jgi:predicted nucleotidyltransferase component of viral defense system
MNSAIKNMLPNQLSGQPDELIQSLREILQSLALLGLWRARFFEQAAFYGGTALRVLYGLDRFSEDLDFSLLHPDESFHFEKYGASLQKELNAFGFETTFEVKHKSVDTAIESAFLKGNTYTSLLQVEAPKEITDRINKQSVIKIKLEIDTNPPQDFNTEMKYIFSPIPFAVRSYTLPSLFAGKIHALLCRKWKNRVKGRDWYDFIWYVSKYPQLNLAHLEQRMRQSGHYSKDEPLNYSYLMTLLAEVIENLDVKNARNEVTPFVKATNSLDIWSKDFFLEAAKRIIVV